MKQTTLLFLFLTLLVPGRIVADDNESLSLLVQSLGQTGSESMHRSILTGMAKGLEGRRRVQTPQGWTKAAKKLSNSGDPQVRELVMELSQIFGDVAAIDSAVAVLKDDSADPNARRNSLRSLLAGRNEEALDLLETLLDVKELSIDAIRGYAATEIAAAPAILLSRYSSMNAAEKRATVETLSTRKFYAAKLAEAVISKAVSRDDVPAHSLRTLTELLDKETYQAAFGEMQKFDQNKEQLLEKYKSMLTEERLEAASASRGRVVYQKTCASCHVMYGQGGKVGPELTGSNRANLDYILLNSVAPSYDVAEGYRTVVVATVDGRLVMGVVAEEDDNRLVLKTVEEPRLVIAKSDIEERKVSEKSMMPEGQLEQLSTDEVADLIKYLQTTQQVEVAK